MRDSVHIDVLRIEEMMNDPLTPEQRKELVDEVIETLGEVSPGIKLRDYFAGQALQGFISAAAFNQEAEEMMNKVGVSSKAFEGKQADNFIAMLAYDVAEAMIDEKRRRDNPGPSPKL